MTKNNKPAEPGLYLARKEDQRWWPYVMRVSGEAPYLILEIVDNQALIRIDRTDFDDLIYHKIEEPKIERS